MSVLTPLWMWLDQRPDRTAVMAEWDRIGNTDVIKPWLMPLEQPARSYPNPRPFGIPMKIVQHVSGDWVAVDESDWEHRLPLQANDCTLHQLNLRQLRSTLCRVLDGVTIAKTPVDQNARCIQIGNWEPKKAVSFPVYGLFNRDRQELQQHILQLQIIKQAVGAILLTPTRTHWDDDLMKLARKGKMLLVAIDEIIDCESDHLFATSCWQEYLQAFCQMVELSLPGNYRNQQSVPMRGTRTANIEKLEKALERHIIAARDHAHNLCDRGLPPDLLPRPDQKALARQIGITETSVSRCLNDQRARVLKILWDTAHSLPMVMQYQRRR